MKGKDSSKKFQITKNWAYLFVIIPLVMQLVLFFYPMIQGVIYSFTDWSGLTQSYNFIALDNYKAVFSDEKFVISVFFTTLLTIGLVFGELVIGCGVAYLLNQKIKGQSFFRATYFFPAVISTVTLGMIFKQIFNYGLIPIGEALNIPWLSQSVLANEKTVFWAVLFVTLWQGVAIPIVIFLSSLQSIPEDIKESATIDGANRWQVFRHIEIPYLATAISMVVILAVKSGITAFDLIFALTGGGPGGKTTSLGLLVYNNAFKSNQFGYASAIAVILFIVIAVISLTQIVLSRKRAA